MSLWNDCGVPTTPRLPPDAFILRDQRIVWVSVAKNACTSIKWMLADLAGEDHTQFYDTITAEVTRSMAIHDRNLWRRAQRPRDLSEDELAEIAPDNGWFVFTVVRDPRLRVWSAWQSKFLQRDPIYIKPYLESKWLPRLPESTEDVLEDFQTFVHWMAEHPEHRLRRDPHFRIQTTRVYWHTTPYTRIYDLADLSELGGDVSAHLAAQGLDPHVSIGRFNDTVLPVRGDLFTDRVQHELEAMYELDFETFGDRWDFARTLQSHPEWSPAAFADIASRASMGERIGDLTRHARALHRTHANLSATNERLEARVEKLQARVERMRERNAAQREQITTLRAAQAGGQPWSAKAARSARLARRLVRKSADRLGRSTGVG